METEDGSENDMLEPGRHQLPSKRMLMKRMKKISNREEVREYRRRRLDVDNQLLNTLKAPRKKGCSDIKYLFCYHVYYSTIFYIIGLKTLSVVYKFMNNHHHLCYNK